MLSHLASLENCCLSSAHLLLLLTSSVWVLQLWMGSIPRSAHLWRSLSIPSISSKPPSLPPPVMQPLKRTLPQGCQADLAATRMAATTPMLHSTTQAMDKPTLTTTTATATHPPTCSLTCHLRDQQASMQCHSPCLSTNTSLSISNTCHRTCSHGLGMKKYGPRPDILVLGTGLMAWGRILGKTWGRALGKIWGRTTWMVLITVGPPTGILSRPSHHSSPCLPSLTGKSLSPGASSKVMLQVCQSLTTSRVYA